MLLVQTVRKILLQMALSVAVGEDEVLPGGRVPLEDQVRHRGRFLTGDQNLPVVKPCQQ
ncbi:hypothetical protein WKI71_24730 [Streptomyces sp. MS1.AVA.1]|uniref:Uncharacterized protein n=1 Tax=Streptomyces machairae TaxID=3134109 RepID=A0ABU8UNI9_9ACTN